MLRRAACIVVVLTMAGVVQGGEPSVQIKPIGKDQLEFTVDGALVTRYHFGSNVAKPYFWPMHAPNGAAVTRAWPMEKGAAKETTDHVHQKSAWFCHGDVIPEGLALKIRSSDKRVAGVDFWSESKGHGTIALTAVEETKNATLRTHNEWRAPDGTKILDESRNVTLKVVRGSYLFVLDIDLYASVCPITFGDTKEGSMGVRVSDEMRLSAKGERSKMFNAAGKSGEKDVWGHRSDWCAYVGEVGGKMGGIAIFDHPSNTSRSCWHSRGYGLMAANPFGRSGAGFPAMKGNNELLKLDKGAHLKLRYGILLFNGDEKSVAPVYELFCKP
jgi:hypothetical protein